jgi:putative DNA primase/helicase
MRPAESIGADLDQATLARSGRCQGREIRFLCPVHEDRHPSARWHRDKRRWYCDVCKAGGGPRDLAWRLGLGAEVRSFASAEVSAVYGYRDAGGRLLFEVVRTVPKGFACRRPDGASGSAWNLNGVERVLYRLPDVAAAVQQGRVVFVVEGEKDADALADLGLAATTNAGGAGKWRAEYGEALRGARVVVIPDNDEAGRGHAAAVLRGLAGVAAETRELALPGLAAKGDVSDWIAAQTAAGRERAGLGEELLRLAAAAALRKAWRARAPTDGAPAEAAPAEVAAAGVAAAEVSAVLRSRRMADVAPEPVSFLWRPYLPLGKLTLLEGDPGQGKSWLTAAIAASGSLGAGLPGADSFAPFRSLLFTAEDGLADTLRPRLDALEANVELIYAHDQPVHLDSAEGLAEIEREIRERRPRLVIVDPVVAFLGARTDIYRANEVRSVLAPLAKIAAAEECAILAVRHVNKSKGGRAIYAGQGSIDFSAAARSVLLAGSAAGDAVEHAMLHIKSNLAARGAGCGYRIEEGRFLWTGESRLTAADLLAAETPSEELSGEAEARAFLEDTLAAGPVAALEVLAAAKAAGIAERTLRRAKSRDGITARKVEAGGGPVWVWRLPR